ncbi:hypothetical protein Q3G72_001740 [Acer saccharum]|nr:hypothetical protein Q3G72_001740 [Acer saccharum]
MNKLSSSPVTFSSLFDSVAKRWLDGRPSIVTALGEASISCHERLDALALGVRHRATARLVPIAFYHTTL